jgi:hypothetical protein
VSPVIFSISHWRVCGPVIGLKRMPAVMPASSSIVLRPLWSSLPWIRFAAVRSSSTAFFRLSWISLSVAARTAVAVRLRPPSSSA